MRAVTVAASIFFPSIACLFCRIGRTISVAAGRRTYAVVLRGRSRVAAGAGIFYFCATPTFVGIGYIIVTATAAIIAASAIPFSAFAGATRFYRRLVGAASLCVITQTIAMPLGVVRVIITYIALAVTVIRFFPIAQCAVCGCMVVRAFCRQFMTLVPFCLLIFSICTAASVTFPSVAVRNGCVHGVSQFLGGFRRCVGVVSVTAGFARLVNRATPFARAILIVARFAFHTRVRGKLLRGVGFFKLAFFLALITRICCRRAFVFAVVSVAGNRAEFASIAASVDRFD